MYLKPLAEGTALGPLVAVLAREDVVLDTPVVEFVLYTLRKSGPPHICAALPAQAIEQPLSVACLIELAYRS